MHLLKDWYNNNDLALIYSSLFPPAEGLLLKLKREMGKHLLLPNRSADAGWAKWAVNGYNLCRMARGELLICRKADL